MGTRQPFPSTSTILTLALLAGAAFAACTSASTTGADGESTSSTAETGAGTSAGGSGGASGLPCDVQTMLVERCQTCHSSPPKGAPMPLVRYDDLVATSPQGETYAERCVVRMSDAMSPMPPDAMVTVPQAERDAFAAWVGAGMPHGSCSDGSGGGGPVPNPYDTPETCTSTVTWAGGEEDWGQYPKTGMHPGMPCIDCHSNPSNYGLPDTGPNLWVGGTVFPTAHEFENCLGVDGTKSATTVEITDAMKQVVELKVGPTGNFFLRKSANTPALVFPIRAVVKSGGKQRAMSGAVSTGDCNSCHTLKGTSNAPGRVMAP